MRTGIATYTAPRWPGYKKGQLCRVSSAPCHHGDDDPWFSTNLSWNVLFVHKMFLDCLDIALSD